MSMSGRKMRTQVIRGFSLVEVLVTILIFALVAGASYMALNSGMRSWRVNNIRVELQQELRKAMDWMSEDLRQSGSSPTVMNVPADDVWYTSVTFKKVTGVSGNAPTWSAGSYQYRRGGTGGTQLERVDDGGAVRVIAQNITSLQLRRLSTAPNIIEMRVATAQNALGGGSTMSANAAFQVTLRN